MMREGCALSRFCIRAPCEYHHELPRYACPPSTDAPRRYAPLGARRKRLSTKFVAHSQVRAVYRGRLSASRANALRSPMLAPLRGCGTMHSPPEPQGGFLSRRRADARRSHISRGPSQARDGTLFAGPPCLVPRLRWTHPRFHRVFLFVYPLSHARPIFGVPIEA